MKTKPPPLKKYTIDQLLCDLDDAIRYAHYDPIGMRRIPSYSIDEYKLEIMRRAKRRKIKSQDIYL